MKIPQEFEDCDVRVVERHTGEEYEANRSRWVKGEWATEADKVEWRDKATGLPCLIVRNHSGALCGYVGVPPGHPAHGKDYNEVGVDVHGGLTYGAACDEEAAICHAPLPGEEADVFWLGFDCAHSHDVIPGHDWGSAFFEPTYKNIAYVKHEVESLAKQLEVMK